jgi:hypothetical protein
MVNEELIAIQEFCASRNVEISFVQSLSESGLLETITIEETAFISGEQLPELDKLVRFHYDMDINLEGIETIYHLVATNENDAKGTFRTKRQAKPL